jgi:hypothetical protein
MPLIRQFGVETGSYLTAHTTIQSYETANPGAGSRWAVSVGIFAGIVPLFRSPVTLAVSQADFLASRLCIQKFRSPRQGFNGRRRSAAGDFGRLGRPKARHFELWSVFIPDLVQGPRTAGPIRLAHRATVRLRYRVANGLRPRPARGLVQGTRVRSSC